MKHKQPKLPQFWDKVVEETKPRLPGISPCWLWIGPSAGGYGRFSTVLAHRAAAAIYSCRFPSKVYMRCGNRRCVRREHLSITYLEDKKPKFSKITGRELLPPVYKDKATIDKVLSSRKEAGRSKDRIAFLTKVSLSAVNKILKESPIYDLLSEVVGKVDTDYQTIPHKRVDTLSKKDEQLYQSALILSNSESINHV